jgi:hypothetical protein
MNGRPQSNRSHNAAHHHTPSSPSSTAYRDTHTVISVLNADDPRCLHPHPAALAAALIPSSPAPQWGDTPTPLHNLDAMMSAATGSSIGIRRMHQE